MGAAATAYARCGRSAARLGQLFALSLILLAPSLPVLGQAARPVAVLQLQGAVDPATADYLVRGIRKAADAGAPLVVIELDTPGGLDTSMRQVIQAILASTVPVAVYVTPSGARAASAGTYILYAAHIAAMAPATTLGAATPVAIGFPGSERKPYGKDADGDAASRNPASAPKGLPGTGDPMTAKQVHDAAAFIRGLAQLRGRNADWAERAVREAVSLTAAEAVQTKVVDVVAKDLPELLALVDGRAIRLPVGEVRLATRDAPYEVHPPDWRQQLLSVIAHPSVALILMMVGIWGLFFEFAAPGHGVSGVTGTICLLLALFALQLLPVNYAALALILVGMALLGAEAFAPTFGVLGAGGVAALVAGGILLYDTEGTGFGVPLPLVAGLALASAVVILLGGGMALKARRKPVVSGREDLLGATGEVLQAGQGEAWAQVRGERWKVASAAPLVAGEQVRVVGLHGLTLDVTAATGSGSQGDKGS
jgi:membrane-bound serine protease (ClpP class)